MAGSIHLYTLYINGLDKALLAMLVLVVELHVLR